MKNLIKIRKAHNLTQQQLAEILNIARTTYQCYEQGKAEPNIEILTKLADYFGCSIDYLLDHQSPNIVHLDAFTVEEQEILNLVKQIDDNQKQQVVGFCKALLR